MRREKREWTTHEGTKLCLELDVDEAALFDRAVKMFEGKAQMDEIAGLYMARDSVLYEGRTGAEVIKLPLYQAIKDMAKRRGLEDGLLSDRPGSRPDLDEFEASRKN